MDRETRDGVSSRAVLSPGRRSSPFPLLGVRCPQDVSEALKALIRDCVDKEMVAEAVRAAVAAAAAAGGSGTPGSAKKRQQAAAQQQLAQQAPLAACASALEALLGYRYRAAWPAMLPVLVRPLSFVAAALRLLSACCVAPLSSLNPCSLTSAYRRLIEPPLDCRICPHPPPSLLTR